MSEDNKRQAINAEEIAFINSFDDSVSAYKIIKKFLQKYGRRISPTTVYRYRDIKKIRIDTWTDPNIPMVPLDKAKLVDDIGVYEQLVIAIIKQAWNDAVKKIWYGKSWTREWMFFKHGFINDIYMVDGSYFI